MEQKQLFREHLFYLGRIKTGGEPQRKYEDDKEVKENVM